MTFEEAKALKPGTAVMFFSSSGPCLPAKLVRANRTTMD